MAKSKLDNILKGGNKFKLQDIDFEDPEFDEMVKAVESEKKRARKQKRQGPRRDIYTD